MIKTPNALNFSSSVAIENDILATSHSIKDKKTSVIFDVDVDASIRPKVVKQTLTPSDVLRVVPINNQNDKLLGVTNQLKYLANSRHQITQIGIVIDTGLSGIIGQSVYCNTLGELTTTQTINNPRVKIGTIVGLNPTKIAIHIPEQKSLSNVESIEQNEVAGLDNPFESLDYALRTLQIFSKNRWYDVVSGGPSSFTSISVSGNNFLITNGGADIITYNAETDTTSTTTYPYSIGFIKHNFMASNTNFVRDMNGVLLTAPNMTYTDFYGNIAVASTSPYVAKFNGVSFYAKNFPSGHALTRVVGLNSSVYIAIGGTHLIAKSTDGGENWVSINTNPIFSETLNWVSITKGNYGVAMTSTTGKVAYTRDGINWTLIDLGINSPMSIEFVGIATIIMSSQVMIVTNNFLDFNYIYDKNNGTLSYPGSRVSFCALTSNGKYFLSFAATNKLLKFKPL